jgi:glycosyltransferase involved in cell wall biosynthesis
MKVLEFGGYLGLGGTEKAMSLWSIALKNRGHEVTVLAISSGPRESELRLAGIEIVTCPWQVDELSRLIAAIKPDVIHLHGPGLPAEADMIGESVKYLSKIPIVQTNVFGRLQNPKENAWIDFRLFISWTSCVQAARRSSCPLNEDFFRRASVAVYPLSPENPPAQADVRAFRNQHGVHKDEILFGRLSRPEPNKWTDLSVQAFRLAARRNPAIKLLLREPPPEVRRQLEDAIDRDRFLILPSTGDPIQLALTIASLDAVLHTSSIGESFGYGIAEPMNFGKPVIANSTPWADQAQIELIRHGEGGFIASTPRTMASAILKLAGDADLRNKFGINAQQHIRKLADPEESTDRLEKTLEWAISGGSNARADEDLQKAQAAACYLDQHQFGHSLDEQVALRLTYSKNRFHEWRHSFRRDDASMRS